MLAALLTEMARTAEAMRAAVLSDHDPTLHTLAAREERRIAALERPLRALTERDQLSALHAEASAR